MAQVKVTLLGAESFTGKGRVFKKGRTLTMDEKEAEWFKNQPHPTKPAQKMFGVVKVAAPPKPKPEVAPEVAKAKEEAPPPVAPAETKPPTEGSEKTTQTTPATVGKDRTAGGE